MLKKFLVVVCLSLFSVCLYAQSGQRSATAIQALVGSNYAQVIPNASVSVCVYNSQLSCITPVTIYSDVSLNTVITQPLIANAQGQYNYYLSSGTQVVEKICAPYNQCQYLGILVGGGGSGVSKGNADQLAYYAQTGLLLSGLTLGTNLSITGGVLNAAGTGTPSGPTNAVQYNAGSFFGGNGYYTTDGSGNTKQSGVSTNEGEVTTPTDTLGEYNALLAGLVISPNIQGNPAGLYGEVIYSSGNKATNAHAIDIFPQGYNQWNSAIKIEDFVTSNTGCGAICLGLEHTGVGSEVNSQAIGFKTAYNLSSGHLYAAVDSTGNYNRLAWDGGGMDFCTGSPITASCFTGYSGGRFFVGYSGTSGGVGGGLIMTPSGKNLYFASSVPGSFGSQVNMDIDVNGYVGFGYYVGYATGDPAYFDNNGNLYAHTITTNGVALGAQFDNPSVSSLTDGYVGFNGSRSYAGYCGTTTCTGTSSPAAGLMLQSGSGKGVYIIPDQSTWATIGDDWGVFDANGFGFGTASGSQSNAFHVSNLGAVTSPQYFGPSTAPSGACSPNGAWVFSQDGHATFCNSGTWTTKI